jgi:hypothetical protein
MPDISLPQQIYLFGVIFAFVSFMVVLAFGALRSGSDKRQPNTARQTSEPPRHGGVHAAE